jgi:translation initiation factor IF-2
MTMLTVDDLARDLKVRNEDLLKELVTMGFEVEGPESPLETDDPAALRAQLVTVLPQREVVEQRIKPTVIRRRMKKAPGGHDRFDMPHQPSHRSFEEPPSGTQERHPAPEKVDLRSRDAAKPAMKKIRRPEPARIIEMAPKPESTHAPAKVLSPEMPSEPPVSETPVPEPVESRQVPVAAEQSSPEVQGRQEVDTTPESTAASPADLPVSEGRPRTAQSDEEAGPEVPSEAQAGPVLSAPAQGPTPLRYPAPQTGRQPSESAGEGASDFQPIRGETAAQAEERRAAADRMAKKKKKKEKRVQPAQIIGRVELKKEPPREPERPEPSPVRHPAQEAPRPAPPGQQFRPSGHPAQAPYAPHAPHAPHVPHQPHPIVPDVVLDEEKRKKKKKDKKVREAPEPVVEDDGLKVRRRKEVILKDALYDDGRRGRMRGRGKKPKLRKTEITQPKASKRRIKLPEQVTVASLAHKMSVKATEVIRHLLSQGVAASLNEVVEFDTAALAATEFGFEAEPAEQSEKDFLPVTPDTEDNLVMRPPVVTVMGHVDHGKTSLLDAIRSTHVTDQEAGGITQHIGAHKVKVEKGELVFLDTPGHEAFTAMRARGAQVTDFVVLVVAADDGVMDQTREAINHSRAAEVPLIVAVNKMDKPEADKDRVIRELSEFGLIPESWGGDTLFSYVSAKTGAGVPELLDLILLQAEMMELRANPNKQAIGTIVEARLDKGKGPVATVLIKEGTLKAGDPFVTGIHYGKVRAMLDSDGRSVEVAGPATPVEVQGFSGVPDAGDSFIVVDEERIARQVSIQRQDKIRQLEASTSGPGSLEELLARIQEQEVKELNLIVKGDVQGSVEAVKEALVGIPSSDIKVKVIHSGVGGITESDIMLANASRAIIIGFNVRPTPKASQLAENEKVDIRLYTIIYEAIEDVRKAMEGMLAPIEKETVMGRAEVMQTFSVPKIGLIAGCHVRSGKIERSNLVRLIRDDKVVYSGKISSMKRFKDDIKEAVEGYECGIGLENYRDVKVGDFIEAYIIEKESAKLTP